MPRFRLLLSTTATSRVPLPPLLSAPHQVPARHKGLLKLGPPEKPAVESRPTSAALGPLPTTNHQVKNPIHSPSPRVSSFTLHLPPFIRTRTRAKFHLRPLAQLPCSSASIQPAAKHRKPTIWSPSPGRSRTRKNRQRRHSPHRITQAVRCAPPKLFKACRELPSPNNLQRYTSDIAKMSGEAWLYLFAVIINAVNLFLQVFFTIMYSDLEWYEIPRRRTQTCGLASQMVEDKAAQKLCSPCYVIAAAACSPC